MLCESIIPFDACSLGPRDFSPDKKPIPLSRARFLKIVCLCMCFVKSRQLSRIFCQTHLALVRTTAEWRELGEKRRLAPRDRALCGIRQDIPVLSRSFHFFLGRDRIHESPSRKHVESLDQEAL